MSINQIIDIVLISAIISMLIFTYTWCRKRYIVNLYTWFIYDYVYKLPDTEEYPIRGIKRIDINKYSYLIVRGNPHDRWEMFDEPRMSFYFKDMYCTDALIFYRTVTKSAGGLIYDTKKAFVADFQKPYRKDVRKKMRELRNKVIDDEYSLMEERIRRNADLKEDYLESTKDLR